jgi:PAS domain S-box-containing protein
MLNPSEIEQEREIRRLRQALRQSVEKWDRTFDAVSDWVSIIDTDFRITQTNRAVETLLGMPRERVLGSRCYELTHGTAQPVDNCPVCIAFNTKLQSRSEIQLKNGAWARISAEPILDEHGELIGAVHVARDISRDKAAEDSLRENEERLAFTAKAGDLGLWDWHADIRWLSTNNQFLTVTGLGEGDVHNFDLDDWFHHVHPKDRHHSREVLYACLDGNTQSAELAIRFWNVRQLKWVWVYVSGQVIGHQSSPGPDRIVGIIQDITRRMEHEEERESLIGKLSKALSEVKTLSGLLPICANCKKIRDDQGYWSQIEDFIQQHSDAAFSHGICPDCAEKLYPGIDIY